MTPKKTSSRLLPLLVSALAAWFGVASAAPPPGAPATQTLAGNTITKYVDTLVIPPAMPKSPVDPVLNPEAADYRIAVRQFTQQILPAPLPATTVWSYGSIDFPATFNYPAFTIENVVNTPTKVKWINDLKDPVTGNFLPHLLPVDQTLHWANPGQLPCVAGMGPTDCRTANPALYTGPVPLVTHVHGAHVGPESDGYPEAWWLPAAVNIPAGYATKGSRFSDAQGAGVNPGNLGYAIFNYPNTQRASTIWYHDHSLGLTRLNVYAGPAGFWLIRGAGGTEPDLGVGSVLPGPGPAVNSPATNATGTAYEIPIAIQDRAFNADGSLFYADNRAYFEGQTATVPPVWNLNAATFPFIGGATPSDVSPIWNPEFFADTMVVNGKTWPFQNVQPKRYRLRLLNGCDARTLNLALQVVAAPAGSAYPVGTEIPIYVIGTEGGLLPQVVEVKTGFKTPLPGNGTIPASVAVANAPEALLMMPAERMDVIVDFSALPVGTRVRMINTAPDFPFNGNWTAPPAGTYIPADPLTTGQVMEFVVIADPANPPIADPSTPPASLVLSPLAAQPAATATRTLSLNELDSSYVCVAAVTPQPATGPAPILPYQVLTLPAGTTPATFFTACTTNVPPGIPFGPVDSKLGTVSILPSATPGGLPTYVGNPLLWMDAITEVPLLGATEVWELYNYTVDAHPIHPHQVVFRVVNRQALDPILGSPVGAVTPPSATETGWKDTVIALPGMVTRVQATFDIAGRYVWHCHIIEHEDNEMMRPYDVATLAGTILDPATGAPVVGATVTATPAVGTALTTTTDATGFYYFVAPAQTYTITATGVGLGTATGTGIVPADPLTGQPNGNVVVPLTVTSAANTILTGTVTSGGVGVPGVTVTATDTVTGATYTTVTSATGTYTLSVPTAGTYTITTTKAGFGNVTTPAAAPVAGTPVDVAISTVVNGTLSGTVTVGGALTANVTVTLTPGAYVTTTSAAGAYSFSVPPGTYTVTATATAAGATYTATATATVNSGAATTVPAIALTTPVTTVNLTGVITDAATGLPIANVTVTANPGGYTAVTDAAGSYTIAVPPGTYTLTTSAVGFVNTATTVTVDNAGNITAGTGTVAVSPATPGTVTGTITDANGNPIPGATVTLNPGGYTGVTDAAGNYSIAAPPGNYTVTVTAPGFTGGTGGGGVSEGGTSDVDVELEAEGNGGGGGGGGGGSSSDSGWCFITSLQDGAEGEPAPLGATAGVALLLVACLSTRLVRRKR